MTALEELLQESTSDKTCAICNCEFVREAKLADICGDFRDALKGLANYEAVGISRRSDIIIAVNKMAEQALDRANEIQKESDVLYRMQDKDGRGPFKPGVTILWSEFNNQMPSILEEFPFIISRIKPYHAKGLHLGCAVRSDKINDWFSRAEQNKLNAMGYKLVTIKDYEIVEESNNQVIFASKKPLWKLK